jgi:RecA-family ATPase
MKEVNRTAATTAQETQARGQESTNQHANPAKAASWGKFQFPAEYDKEREAEMIGEAAAYDREKYDLYLNSLATQEPDLLTRSKIADIAGRFHTIKDLSAGAYEPNGWIVNRLIPSESIVTLQGQAKSGKSTFILHMIKELISGGEFLGERLEPIKVVYVTEQNRKSFLSQLGSADIDPSATNLTALTVEGTLGLTGWKHLFQVCERELLETGAKLLVIDSWGRFTGITEQEENKTAPVQAVSLRLSSKSVGS